MIDDVPTEDQLLAIVLEVADDRLYAHWSIPLDGNGKKPAGWYQQLTELNAEYHKAFAAYYATNTPDCHQNNHNDPQRNSSPARRPLQHDSEDRAAGAEQTPRGNRGRCRRAWRDGAGVAE